MQFSGEQLHAILKQQTAEVAVYDGQGFLRGNVRPLAATRMIAEREYVGIGNKRRIRYIRPLWAAMHISDYRNGSQTTTRIRNHGTVISPPLIREFKPQPVPLPLAKEVVPFDGDEKGTGRSWFVPYPQVSQISSEPKHPVLKKKGAGLVRET